MKAILAEHRFPIPEEFQPKVKAMAALLAQIQSERHKTSPNDYGLRSIAFEKLRSGLYKEIIGAAYADYPVWDVSDSGDEFIGYEYKFEEEG